MERERSRPPEEDRPAEVEPSEERVRGDAHLAAAAAQLAQHREGQLRCPYCRGSLRAGDRGARCARCETLHHPGCFAEHGGCSTHECPSTRATTTAVGEPPPPPFRLRVCRACDEPCPADAIVARCCCARVLHTGCFEAVGGCGAERCAGPVELLHHAEVVAATRREVGLALTVKGALIAGAFGVLSLIWEHEAAVVLLGAVAAGLVPLGGGLFMLHTARRIRPRDRGAGGGAASGSKGGPER